MGGIGELSHAGEEFFGGDDQEQARTRIKAKIWRLTLCRPRSFAFIFIRQGPEAGRFSHHTIQLF
jgi:hypothetical protein